MLVRAVNIIVKVAKKCGLRAVKSRAAALHARTMAPSAWLPYQIHGAATLEANTSLNGN